jgi:hypothetical protein
MPLLGALADFFVNPWLLGGLALASAPVIIHLLNKRRYRVHDWAAMDFLLQALTRQRRRLKFEDLILLLLRVALIVLVVLAVARPLVKGWGGWREDERVVVLDDSFSMDLAAPGGSVFELAREGALQQVRDAVGGSIPVTVALGSRPEAEPKRLRGGVRGGLVVDDEGSESPEVDAAGAAALESSALLDSLKLAATSDLPLRLDVIVERLLEEMKADKSPRQRVVVLLSDFRRSDWLAKDGALDGGLAAAFEALAQSGLAKSLRFRFVDVGQPAAENVAVSGFRVESGHVVRGLPVRLQVEATNFGRAAREGLEGEIEVGEPDAETFRPSHRIPIAFPNAIAPGASASIGVEHTFEKAGRHPLRVRLGADALPRDDESSLVVPVREGLEVAVVDGDPSPERFAGESGYLLAALAPRTARTRGITPRLIDRELSAAALEGADVLLILNRGELSLAERDVLEGFVQGGGGLGFFLGNRVDPERYHDVFDGGAVKAGSAPRPLLFPVHLEKPQAAGEGDDRAVVHFEDLEHPAMRLFRGIEGSALGHVLFSHYFQLLPEAGALVVATYSDAAKTPAVVEAARAAAAEGSGRRWGRAVVFNTSADRDWSDWPADPSFPIVLGEWVRYLAPEREASAQVEAGGVVRVEARPGWEYELRWVDAGAGETSVPVVSDRERRSEAAQASDAVEFTAEAAGFLVVRGAPRGGNLTAPGPFASRAASIPPRASVPPSSEAGMAEWFACTRALKDSDLEPMGEARLRAALEPLGVEFTVGTEVDVDAFRQAEEGEAWRTLAWSAGLVLLLELFLAWWFGRR